MTYDPRPRRPAPWGRLYRTSVALGLRNIVRGGARRQALIRVLVPMDPTRYLELGWAYRGLSRVHGDGAILDLASPKLLAVQLARDGEAVTCVDSFPSEIETWRALAGDEPGLRLLVADGRRLPFGDASFGRAVSISVLEHVGGEDGDSRALCELARCVRPGGSIFISLPAADERWDEFRSQPVYGSGEPSAEGYLFQRWYDAARVDELLAGAPDLEIVSREVVRLNPDLDAVYTRAFPWLIPFGLAFGFVAREMTSTRGIARLELRRR